VRAAALWVLFGLLVTVCPARADLTVAAYRIRVGQASDLAREAETAPEAQATALIRQARERFPARATVRVAKDLSVTVQNRVASERLEEALFAPSATARAKALERFSRRAETLVDLLEPGFARRDPGELATVKGILAQPPFAPSAFEKWERELQERWRNWWREFARRFLGNPAPATMERVATVLYWVVIALLVVLLAYLIWTYVPGLRLPSRAKAAPGEADEIVAPERARERLAAAEAAAAAGRYLEALRLTYAAMLLLLDEAQILPYDPARTNREVLRALRRGSHAPAGSVRRPPAATQAILELLAPVTRSVDEKLYGGRPTTAADYSSSRDACTSLMGLLSP
jgi:hypothetical protein